MNKYEVQPLDLMQFINAKYHEGYIHEYIELEKQINVKQLANAIERLVREFPILNSIYKVDENVFLEKEKFDIDDLLSINDNIKKEELLLETINIEEKLIHFTLTDNMLYITISHLVCDGSGFKQLVYLLCEFYNNPNKESDYTYLMNRNFDQLTNKMSKSSTSKMTFSLLKSMMGNYKSFKVYDKSQNENYYLVMREISDEKMEKIHKYAKSKGATLNDVFLTAFARALYKNYKWEKFVIPCTVDLRKYAEGETGIGNLTGNYFLNIKMKNEETSENTLIRVSEYMKKQKKTKNDLAGPLLLVSKYKKSSLDSFMKLYGNMDTSSYTDFTNLGIVDEKRLNFGNIKVQRAVTLSVTNIAPCFQLSVSSFKGETTLSSLVFCSKEGKIKVDNLFDVIVEEIESFVKGNI